MPRCTSHLSINPGLLQEARGRRRGGPMREAILMALREALEWWKKSLFPRHFQADARQRYSPVYTPRTAGYKKRKMKEGHGRTDLVYTGRLRDTLLQGPTSTQHRIESTSLRVTVTLPFARVVNLWTKRTTKHGHYHDFPSEISAIIPEEVEALRARIEHRVWEQLAEKFAEGEKHMVTTTEAA